MNIENADLQRILNEIKNLRRVAKGGADVIVMASDADAILTCAWVGLHAAHACQTAEGDTHAHWSSFMEQCMRGYEDL